MTVVEHANPKQLGEESSIWFKLTPLLKASSGNPMQVLMQMAERYGPVLPINMANQRVIMIFDPQYFKHVMVTKPDTYVKYFDGLTPIFGKAMITTDGALWQKIRAPQQPAFHPGAFDGYIPYFNQAIRTKMDTWADFAKSGDTFEMVEQTWTLAADMICKALFDRDMPFNPHVVFKCVKTYTDVMNHKDIRLRKQAGELFEMSDEDASKAIDMWWSVPPEVMAADPNEHREKTLLKMIEAAVQDENIPEFDEQQAIDELKQYLWAGTETTALTLAWALYLTSKHPEAAARIRAEGEEVCGDREPTSADYSALQYTRAVIQETMRIYPPIWGFLRVAAESDEIAGVEIRKDDRIFLFGYGAHHNPKFWEEPEEFRPERWIGDQAKKRVKYSYIPFGAGKRSCIGGAMSQVENTLALVQLLRRFQPEYVGQEPPSLNATVTLTPKGGLPFKMHELNK
ncbi:MAG: cytochrome P450 [Hyphomicrobiaceae bacterium]